jgi:hypothetical protein
MTNLVQFILLIVIVTLTFLIAFVAVQVFHILHDFRSVLKRVDKVLDNPQTADPAAKAEHVMTELGNIVKESESELIQKTAQRIQAQVQKKNFFKRRGTPLRPS